MRIDSLLRCIVALFLSFAAATAVRAASYTWVGANADWTASINNWTPAGIPGAADVANINNGTTVTVSSSISVGALVLTNSTVTGTGALNVAGLTWSGGTMSGTGTTTVQSMTMSGSPTLDRRTLNATGTVMLSGTGTWTFQNSAIVTFQSTATATMNSDMTIAISGVGGVFNNAGSFTKSGGVGTANVAPLFNNSGTVIVQSGTLSFNGGGVDSAGSYAATGATATLKFGNGTRTTPCAFSGTGHVNFGPSGGVTLSGNYNVTGRTTVDGSIVAFNGTVTSVGSPLAVNFGTANFAGNSFSVNTLNHSGGILTGTGTVTVTSALTWSGGTASGSGTTTVATPATLTVTGSGAATLSARTLNLLGNGVFSGVGNWTLSNNAQFAIAGSATFDLQGDQSIAAGALGGTINNSGVFKKSNGSLTSAIATAFNNMGSVGVLSGTLGIGGDGTDTAAGSYTVSAGKTLFFSSASRTIASAISGAGLVEFGPAVAITVSGTYNVTGKTTVSAGTVTFTNPIASLGTMLTLDFGVLDLGTNNVSVATFLHNDGELTGSGTLTVASSMAWPGANGSLESGSGKTVLAPGAFLAISNTPTMDQRTIELSSSGTVRGSWTFSNNASLHLKPGSTLDINFDLDISGTGTILNEGTISRSATTLTGFIEPNFDNHGAVNVHSGILAFYGNGVHQSASFSADPGAEIWFLTGTHTLDANSSIIGGGNAYITTSVTINGSYGISGTTHVGGPVAFNGTITSPLSSLIVQADVDLGANIVSATILSHDSGTLTGTGSITVSSVMTWSGGTAAGTGTTAVAPGATLDISGGPVLDTRTFELFGDAAFSAHPFLDFINNPTFNIRAGATFDCQSDGTFAQNGTINNSGIFKKSGGNEDTLVGPKFFNTGTVQSESGIFSFSGPFSQSVGNMILAGADFEGTFDIQGGSVFGSGQVRGNLKNNGFVLAGFPGSPSTLTVTGNYTQFAAGAYVVEISGTNPGTEFGVLTVQGTATLAGTLNPGFSNGYLPTAGDTYEVLTFATANGTLALTQPPADPPLIETVGATSLTLQAAAAAPVITSALNDAATVGVPYTYTITASNNATSFNATGLPAGLSVDTATGIVSGTPTASGNFNVLLAATNATGTGSATLILTVSLAPGLAPSIDLFESGQSPAIVNTPVTFTLVATDPDSATLHYVINFGDGSAHETGTFGGARQVFHTFASAGDFIVTANVSDGTTSVSKTLAQNIVAPASGAENVLNVSQGDTVNNPVDNLAITVMNSAGGVLQLQVSAPEALLSRAPLNFSTTFGDIAGRSAIVPGTQPVHQFIRRGVFVATTLATHRVTGQLMGKGRKTLVISARETGEVTAIAGIIGHKNHTVRELPNAANQVITIRGMKGKFIFDGSRTDSVTFSGTFQLPAGVDPRAAHEFSMGIGNIVVDAMIDAKCRGTQDEGAPQTLKKLKLSYLKIKKGQLSKGGETAKVDIVFNRAALVDEGFDTEGITPRATDVSKRNPVPRSIQIGLVLDGAAYEVSAPVTFSISNGSAFGAIQGRK